MPDFEIERRLWRDGYAHIAGVDEAGRGCLAGPVVAAAVVLPPDARLPGLDDSKKLSPEARDALFSQVHAEALATGIGMCSAAEIDRLNVLWASMEAMRRALADLALVPGAALIDGNRVPPEAGAASGERPKAGAAAVSASGIVMEPVVKGDARSLSIAAASILAKVTRDRHMVTLDQTVPGYGFAGH
ncbi:MAG: ribonuclease HII, partial [Bacteroidota bacterium]